MSLLVYNLNKEHFALHSIGTGDFDQNLQGLRGRLS
jgi:hypothetical protein